MPFNPVHAGESAGAPGTRTDAAPKQEIRLERLTPEYWRVTLDNPPFNIFGPETIPQLNSVITQIETDPKVKVVVFQSAVPGFFLTHYDFVAPLSATTGISPGATGLPALPDMLVRLSRAPVVSIVSIRGRATGVGSELSLASDMRFASREKALLSQWEIGAGLVPGGGPMARLPRLIGRGRALEVLATSTARCPTPSWTTSWTRWPGASPGSTSSPSPTSSAWSTSRACRLTPRSAPNGTRSWPRCSARRPSKTSSA
jgi:hypothetical protein